jgi:hypothetical protein
MLLSACFAHDAAREAEVVAGAATTRRDGRPPRAGRTR